MCVYLFDTIFNPTVYTRPDRFKERVWRNMTLTPSNRWNFIVMISFHLVGTFFLWNLNRQIQKSTSQCFSSLGPKYTCRSRRSQSSPWMCHSYLRMQYFYGWQVKIQYSWCFNFSYIRYVVIHVKHHLIRRRLFFFIIFMRIICLKKYLENVSTSISFNSVKEIEQWPMYVSF